MRGVEEAIAEVFHHHGDADVLRCFLLAAGDGREQAGGNGRQYDLPELQWAASDWYIAAAWKSNGVPNADGVNCFGSASGSTVTTRTPDCSSNCTAESDA